MERMIGNVVISKVRALKYVVVRKEKGSETERVRERSYLIGSYLVPQNV